MQRNVFTLPFDGKKFPTNAWQLENKIKGDAIL